MTSPAESHRERLAETAAAARLVVLKKQIGHMHSMLHDCGFGFENSPSFAEREIYRYLNAAFELIQLDLRSRRED